MANALIFRCSRTTGYFLTELCKARGIEPIGVSRTSIEYQGDVGRYEQVDSLIGDSALVYF